MDMNIIFFKDKNVITLTDVSDAYILQPIFKCTFLIIKTDHENTNAFFQDFYVQTCFGMLLSEYLISKLQTHNDPKSFTACQMNHAYCHYFFISSCILLYIIMQPFTGTSNRKDDLISPSSAVLLHI